MPNPSTRPLPTILGFSLFFLLALAGLACSNLADEAAVVSLRNDTNETLVLRQCNVDCRRIQNHSEVPPDESIGARISPRGIPTWYEVADTSGTSRGCISLSVEGHPTDVVYNLSSVQDCPPPANYGSNDAFAIGVIALFIGVPLLIVTPIIFFGLRRRRRANSPG